MGNTFKKVLSTVLAMLMLISIVPTQLFAASVSDPFQTQTSSNFKNNVFLDALKYLGYNTSRFVNYNEVGSDVASTYRSDIGYNDAGAYGTEVSSGEPNISYFESNGLCCGSYAAYVYFNYLPNVYGLDTSFLTKPSNCRSTTAWATACEQWVSGKNATKTSIGVKADNISGLASLKNVPLGSILIFKDAQGNYLHTSLYAGYRTSGSYTYYYQTHCGNSRGPEVCLINDFNKSGSIATLVAAYTPIVPQATKGAIGVYKVDDIGNAVSGAKIGVYSDKNCTNLVTTLITDANGKATYGYSGGEYSLKENTTYYFKETTAPTGYDKSTQVVSATVVADTTTYASTKIVDNRQGWIRVYKYDDAGKQLGAGYVFGVYTDKACTTKVGTMTTNDNGYCASDWLTAGTYYVKETNIPSTDKTHKLNTTVYTVVVPKGTYVAVNSGKFVNELMRGNATVTKTSEDGVVEGFTFRLHGTSDSGEAVNITAVTNASGKAIFGNVLVGTYTVEEVGTPNRYVAPASKTVIVTDGGNAQVSFENLLKRSNLTVTKTAEDGLVKDVQFQLTGTSLTGSEISETIKTDANGIAVFENLLPSDSNGYTLTEEGVADYYVPVGNKVIFLADGVNGEVTVHNALKKGTVEVTKTAEDGLVEGISFRLQGVSQSGTAVDMIAVTDKNGVATFNDVLISGATPYTIEEVDTNIKYVIPETQNGAVAWNEVTKVSFNNILKKFSVTITKVDRETTMAQGDASLAGAVYGIYNDGKLIDTYTTDVNGKFTTCEYICGENWTVKEIKPSEGYLLDDTVYTVGANPELYVLENNSTSNTVTEQVIKGKIYITKLAVKDKNEVGSPEEGAIFTISHKKTGKVVDTLTINKDGVATSKALPYGTYIVHQERGWEGYKNVSDFEVFIDTEGKVYSYILNDYVYSAYIKVTKVDAETNKTVAYSGAGFQIYDADGNLVKIKVTYPTHTEIDTFYTDSNGILITPSEIAYGDYTLVEVKAPHGYVLDSTPVPFTVNLSTMVEEDGLLVVKVTKRNYAQKGTITVFKEGEVFWDVSQSDGKYAPEYKTVGLAGAVYMIYADEDIKTLDGTIRVPKDTLVDTITTDSTGYATSKELYLGKYRVVEVKAPHGYVLDSTPKQVEIVYGSQTDSVVSTGTSFTNDRQKVEISLKKVMKENADFGIGNNGEVENVKFGLYANENLTAANGTVLPKDGFIEEVTVDSTGNVKFSSDLPFGQYYIKEIATDDHYIINGTKYLVTFSYAGQDKNVVSLTVNNGTVENKLKYGSVDGTKVDEYGKPLGDAVIGLYLTEDASEPVYTTVSDSNGKFRFDKVPFGTYYVREITQPEGFLLNTDVFPVTIVENGDVVKVTIVNEYIKGSITLTKVDKDYPENKLTGAIFTIYRDSNNNGVYDKADKTVGNLTETSIGVYESELLIYGRYFVKETKAPVGFVADSNAYEVFIDTHGKVYTISNNTSGCFINSPALGNLRIIKTSEDGVVEGFEFRVTGTSITGQSYDETFVTDANGEILIENLRIGEYTVTELNVADRYITPADVTVSVETDGTAVANIYNALKRGNIVVNKTAEDDILEGHKFHLYGISLSGIEVDEYAITDENGIAKFENILISDLNGYVIEEVETADRYLVPAEQTVNVEYKITSDVEFYNELKRGNITLTKVDNEFRDKLLSGAEFEVYFDVNDNGVFDEDIDTLVGVMSETEVGIYRIDDVRYGGYFVHEKTAPNHYIADIGYYYVAVLADGETVVAENTEGTGLFINGIKRGSILIVKTSEDGKKEGFSFLITGNGINMTVVTDANGEALIENLRVDSDYTIEEIEDEVSAKYIRPEAVNVTLLDGMTLIVNLYNQIAPVPEIPNTDGEDTDEAVEKEKRIDMVCLIISLAGVPFMLVLGYFFVIKPKMQSKKNSKKKYKKDNR